MPAPWESSTPAPGRLRRQLPPRPGYDARLELRLYRDHLLALALAADLEGVPLAAWCRRALSAAAGAVLRRSRALPRRVTDTAAAGMRADVERSGAD